MTFYLVSWKNPGNDTLCQLVTEGWKILQHGWLQIDGAAGTSAASLSELFPPGLTGSISIERLRPENIDRVLSEQSPPKEDR